MMSEHPHDQGNAPAEEAIVLRNSAPARVSFNEKTGKAQRKRNLFNDDQAAHAPQDDELHGESNRIIKEDERLLHAEDSSFQPSQSLRLEIEPSAGAALQADDQQPASNALQVELETPDDNRLHPSEPAPTEARQLRPSDGSAADHHEPLPQPAAASHRELLPETEQSSHYEKLTIRSDGANKQTLPDQPTSLLPPDLPSLELTPPNVVHVQTEVEVQDEHEDEVKVKQEAGFEVGHEAKQEVEHEVGHEVGHEAPTRVQPAAKAHARRMHLSMDVHQRERMAEAVAESAVIDERLHHAEERVIKLTDQILKGSG
jgi:hypothetical protein